MPNAPKTPNRVVRIDDQLWDELGAGAQLLGTDRSDIIREGARRELRRRLRARSRDQAAHDAA